MTTRPNIEELVAEKPLPSEAVLRKLEASGLSQSAARKRLERDQNVRRLKGLGFPKNQQLVYLKHQWVDGTVHMAIREAWESFGTPHAHAIAALGSSGGILTRAQFRTRAGAPLRLTKQTPIDAVLRLLVRHKFVQVRDDPRLGECVVVAPAYLDHRVDVATVRARLVAEGVLLKGVRDWARKTGFVSWDAVRLRGDEVEPEIAQFPFDLTGPSYVRPLATPSAGNVKPGFLVADVWMGSELSAKDLGGVIRKANVIRSMPRSRPFIAMLVAERFEPEALRLGKKEGILVVTPGLLFGDAIAKALRALVDALAHAARAIREAPSVVHDLFEHLARIEGAAANLRGPLFELIVAHSMAKVDGGQVDVGTVIKTPRGEQAEIDVLAAKSDAVRACECRGHANGHIVTREEVERWRTTRVPRWREWFSAHHGGGVELSCEYWTTGTFDAEAKEYLEQERERTRKYVIQGHDGQSVLRYVRRTRTRHLVDALKEHYLAPGFR